jgi:septal ring-binding cell division protein DamX
MAQELDREKTVTEAAPVLDSQNSEPDLAAEAKAELAASEVQSGGYAFAEADLLSMSGMALQLVVLSNETAVKDFRASYPGLDIYTYQRQKNGQRQLVVVMAPFADSTEAKAQISQLPPALQQAFVKPLADIHSEISIQ